jgi:adenosylhomocysteine nucleosidase
MSFAIKMVGSVPVLYVMAVDAEYGPHLQKRFQPLLTGVGPVEAAVALTQALASLKASGTLPKLVVCLGSAGSANLEQTEVYQASSISYRDMDASPLGFTRGATPFLDLPVTVDLPLKIPGVKQARLSTGANIVSGVTYATIDADMVDMETFAILRACMAFGIPLIGLRGISDGKAELKHVSDWTEYLHVIDAKLASVVDALETGLLEGSIVV